MRTNKVKRPNNWQQMASIIEYADLRVDTQKRDLLLLCLLAEKFNIPAVVVNPINVNLINDFSKICHINIGVAISYPIGAYYPDAKIHEIEDSIIDGADIIYMTMAVGAFLSGWVDRISRPEMEGLVRTANGRPTRLITEGSVLSADQKYALCNLAIESGIDELMICTGFKPSNLPPITVDDIKVFIEAAKNRIKIGYMGDIENPVDALNMIDLGISHFCTFSAIKLLSFFSEFQKI